MKDKAERVDADFWSLGTLEHSSILQHGTPTLREWEHRGLPKWFWFLNNEVTAQLAQAVLGAGKLSIPHSQTNRDLSFAFPAYVWETRECAVVVWSSD